MTTNPWVMTVARFNNPKVGALATVLFDAFKHAEPDHGISKFPASFRATFADMAHASFAYLASLPAASEGEEIPYACDACTTGLYDRCECHPVPANQEKLLDLLTKATDDIAAALMLAGKADKIAKWTAPYVAAINDADAKVTAPTLTAGEGGGDE